MHIARIAIDARHLKTGIGAYTFNLIVQLDRLQLRPRQILSRSEDAARLEPLCKTVSVVNSPIYSLREQITVPLAVESQCALHVPHYNVPLLHKGPLLVTIHDITHILYPEYAQSWKSRLYGKPMIRAAVRRADHLFTVSEYSKQRIIEAFRIHPEKITVVYNGVGEVFSPSDPDRCPEHLQPSHGISRPYALYVGSLKPHKNVETLVRAFARIASGEYPDFELVIAGGGDSQRLSRLAADLGVRPIFVPNANDLELANLYRGARVSVLPSFEEGFGLPIVEAMACGTPVICSNAASMPEIAGDAALLFDPKDDLALSNLLRNVLSSDEHRSFLVKLGLARAAKFTWRKTAQLHTPVYENFAT